MSRRRHRLRHSRSRVRRGKGYSYGACSALLLWAVFAVAAGGGYEAGRTNPNSAVGDLPPSLPAQPPTQASPAILLEGKDYSFMAKVNGKPIRWNCASEINVTLIGNQPAGSQDALQTVVPELGKASGLPLRLTPPKDSRDGTARAITVYYGPIGTSIDVLALNNPGELGVGGPVWNDKGDIVSGAVLVRDDTSSADPRTPEGRHVLMHEVAHALGLGHSEDANAELMVPESSSDSAPTLGPGDHEALRLVGCPT